MAIDLMIPSENIHLIEHQTIEYKQIWKDNYLKWICGFANAQGGKLYIGKNDQGEVTGLVNAERLLVEIPNKVRDMLGIMVDVNLLHETDQNGQERDYLEIIVEPYPSPISYKGQYHYRSGSTKQELKGAALDAFLLKKHGLHWDGVPMPGFSAEDCSAAAFNLFKTRAANSGRVDEHVLNDGQTALLENLQLTEGDYLKRAATLLFFEQPEKFVSGAYIKLGFFVTDDDLRYQDEIHGNLFAQVEQAMEILKLKYLKAYISYEGLQRLETYLFPIQALREALLNAVIHKDYSSGIPIQVSVYEHQIVIWNAGQLPESWTLERLLGKHPSTPYNPLLANAFFRSGHIESWGRGIEKIQRECREHDIPIPLFDLSMSGLMLTFQANPMHLKAVLGETTQEMPEKASEKASEKTSEKILGLVGENAHITIAELASAIGVTGRSIERNIQKLQQHGKLKRVGPAKGGYWEVLK